MVWFPGFILLLQELILTQGSPAFHSSNEALLHAKRNGLDTAEYDSFSITELLEFSNGDTKPFNHKGINRRRDVDNKTILHVPVQGDRYIIHLSHQKHVLHPEAPIVLTDGDSKQTVDVSTPNCYLVGNEQSHGGTASFSYCHGLRGAFSTKGKEIVLLPIEGQQRHLVAIRKTEENETDLYEDQDEETTKLSNSNDDFIDEELQDDELTTNPADTSGKVVIEIGVYIDADYYTYMEVRGQDTLAKKMDFILVKWNAVQYEYSKKEQLGRVVEIQLKKMDFFKTNPKWLRVTNKLGSLLGSICRWNRDKEPFDTIYLHSAHSPLSPQGLAYVGGACKSGQRCAASQDRKWGKYRAIAHELGHNLKMSHDFFTPCKNFSKSDLGVMGGLGTNFSVCSAAAFQKKLNSTSGQCLFVENVKIVQPELKHVKLNGLLPLLYHTFDDLCSFAHGVGYRYREIVFNNTNPCDKKQLCVNLDPSSKAYSLLLALNRKSIGQYCADGKACYSGKCVPYKYINLHVPLTIRQGQWGPWGPYSKCSRTCGTGVTVAQRRCDSPTPMNAKQCPGNEYRAKLCNTKPCGTDPLKKKKIAEARATEICTKLVNSGVLNATEYFKKGKVYHSKDPQTGCETHCSRIILPRRHSRNALLPDGSPCLVPNPQYHIPSGVKNVRYRCLKGVCQPFDCLSTFPPAVYGKDKRCATDGGIVG